MHILNSPRDHWSASSVCTSPFLQGPDRQSYAGLLDDRVDADFSVSRRPSNHRV